MEIPHPNLSKVTRMVLVEIRPVVVHTTGHTTSTGMLAVLSYSSVAGGDMAAAARALVRFSPRMYRWSGLERLTACASSKVG